MAITKEDFRNAVANLIDDPNFAFYTAAKLDTLIGLTMDEKWGEILNFAPFYRSTLESITTAPKLTSAGAIDLSQLGSRFYRIQSLVRDGRTFDEVSPKNLQMFGGALVVGPDFHYAFYGDLVYMFPISASMPLELRYSSLPPAFTGLTTTDPIVWPDGHEAALMYEVGMRAMAKGGREDVSQLAQLASRSWDNLLSRLKRRNLPLVPFDLKNAQDFGGV